MSQNQEREPKLTWRNFGRIDKSDLVNEIENHSVFWTVGPYVGTFPTSIINLLPYDRKWPLDFFKAIVSNSYMKAQRRIKC
jgi:hypothetical protein